MNFKIDDIENLSDSRQVMESKPNKLMFILLYIIIALIVTFFIWSWFSEKEIVVKVNGVVRPNSQIQAVSNIVQGEVESVKMKNGESVSKGDVLFKIKSTELEDKKSQIDEQIEYIDIENENLKKFNKSINDNINYFKNNDKEKEYYYKFQSYELGNKIFIEEKNNIYKDKNRTTVLAQIEEKLNLNSQKRKELEENKKQIEQSIEKCTVKAPSDGKLNINTNLEPGVVLQNGVLVANIIPNSNTYKVELMIPTRDITNIKVSEAVEYNFEALPYIEYGFLDGKIESLSPDSKVDSEKGIAFFSGEGTINSNSLYSKKGEESFIKSGMVCEVKIITRKEKMLYYLLEKIGLIN